MSKMKDALADVEQSLLDGITADQLEKWLKDQGYDGPEAVVDINWWQWQRLTMVQRYYDQPEDAATGIAKLMSRADCYALLRPEDQPNDLAGGAA